MKDQQTDSCLIIFTRNPELGKGKRRLAASVGDQAAFEIYKFLLAHTREVTRDLSVNKKVWYSEKVHRGDQWDETIYDKYAQKGTDLGERMKNAFEQALEQHEKVVIIGSDLFDLQSSDLQKAFQALDTHPAVIGPAQDGGYYLLGFKKELVEGVFQNKEWGTDQVLQATINDLNKVGYHMLETRNDVDYYEDIKDEPAFEPYLKHMVC
ncbi:TIGR04282 family arsenosugar biosynthesis glycosyltransferase [Nonlabens xiamenensis]|uniref:TIGR04282 family arsenosugar biosynthesis glycosyltransferase n=1 Tax=Nonlabens xiamenensis TaxID=2341043 RepID=UPI000F6118F0|nr:TIGR04282 family arsenosugar biosynthesis glycosyltransferase [Nonlabens xiamenensis]